MCLSMTRHGDMASLPRICRKLPRVLRSVPQPDQSDPEGDFPLRMLHKNPDFHIDREGETSGSGEGEPGGQAKASPGIRESAGGGIPGFHKSCQAEEDRFCWHFRGDLSNFVESCRKAHKKRNTIELLYAISIIFRCEFIRI